MKEALIDLNGTQQSQIRSVTLDKGRSIAVAGKLGLDIVDTGDLLVAVTPDFDPQREKLSTFGGSWMNSYIFQAPGEGERRKMYEAYFVMDQHSDECNLALDTYADEALSIGMTNETPIKITVKKNGSKDSKAQKQLMNIFAREKIIEQARATIRTLAKFGDCGFRVHLDARYKDDAENKLQIDMVHPTEWEAFLGRTSMQKMFDESGFVLRPPVAYRLKGLNQVMMPWEFVQMTIYNPELHPYGRSILEPVRGTFERLVTMESLLAVARSSRIERTIFKVPTSGTNASAIMLKLQEFGSLLKNQISPTTAGANAARFRPRITAATENVVWPSGNEFEVTKLNSSVDISSTEDVTYFLEKLITGLRIPKGYLLADSTTDRGGALASQDKKFSRALLPLQEAYEMGLEKIGYIVLSYLGYDVDEYTIDVKLDKPVTLNDELFDSYIKALDLVDQLVRAAHPDSPATNPDYNPGGSTASGQDRGSTTSATVDQAAIKDLKMSLYKMVGIPQDVIDVLNASQAATPKEAVTELKSKIDSEQKDLIEQMTLTRKEGMREFKSYVKLGFMESVLKSKSDKLTENEEKLVEISSKLRNREFNGSESRARRLINS